MTVTPAVDAKVLVVHASSKNEDVRDCPPCKAKSLQTVAQLTAQYTNRSKRKCFRTHSSADTVRYGTVQQKSHSCASVDQASSSTTPTMGPGTSRLDYG
ncbi:hypothetical protein AVEN_137034-1 [Araneus ventricosus]|uniref:Uncharacterized protein n=1 Tax=Araneus ventricosus TaxID=182803 RepID=A0A4Y2P822_ARAVE|nr:hypothetical protein AVEN_137034-1 [Araneus ventricosus]